MLWIWLPKTKKQPPEEHFCISRKTILKDTAKNKNKRHGCLESFNENMKVVSFTSHVYLFTLTARKLGQFQAENEITISTVTSMLFWYGFWCLLLSTFSSILLVFFTLKASLKTYTSICWSDFKVCQRSRGSAWQVLCWDVSFLWTLGTEVGFGSSRAILIIVEGQPE